MVRRRQDHLLSLCQDHGLQYVYQLRDIGHAHPLTVLIEDVQIDSRYQRIPQ